MVPSRPTEMAGSLAPSGRRSGVFWKERVVLRPATRSIDTGPGPLWSEQRSPQAASDVTRTILTQRCAATAPPLGAYGAPPRNVQRSEKIGRWAGGQDRVPGPHEPLGAPEPSFPHTTHLPGL